MTSIEELEKRKRVLENEAKAREEIEEIERKRKKLKREVSDLQFKKSNPKTAKAFSIIGSIARKTGEATVRGVDRLTAPTVMAKSPVRRKSPVRKAATRYVYVKRKSPVRRRVIRRPPVRRKIQSLFLEPNWL